MSCSSKPNVGKYTLSVQPSKESGPNRQDRIEALANWLLKQWKNRHPKKKDPTCTS
jgi:hypothetical protein